MDWTRLMHLLVERIRILDVLIVEQCEAELASTEVMARTAAADRIYVAATDLLIRQGFDAFDIDTLASKVHCSRATIYRYAGGKAPIRDAVLLRLSASFIDTVRRAVEGLSGPERVLAAITVALEQMRSEPIRRLMLSSSNSPELGEFHSSPVLAHLAAELAGIADADPQAAQWIVRLVVSLAYWPAGNSRVERQMLKRFVAPVFKA
jgi:AcrR family transcriptional regulator